MSNSIEKIKEIARKIARIELEIAGEKIVRQERIEQETKRIKKKKMEGGRIKEIEIEEPEKKLKE